MELGELITDKPGLLSVPWSRATDLIQKKDWHYSKCTRYAILQEVEDVKQISTPALKLDIVPWKDGDWYNAANAMLNDVKESVGLAVRLPRGVYRQE
jgi:hypothetical protein